MSADTNPTGTTGTQSGAGGSAHDTKQTQGVRQVLLKALDSVAVPAQAPRPRSPRAIVGLSVATTLVLALGALGYGVLWAPSSHSKSAEAGASPKPSRAAGSAPVKPPSSKPAKGKAPALLPVGVRPAGGPVPESGPTSGPRSASGPTAVVVAAGPQTASETPSKQAVEKAAVASSAKKSTPSASAVVAATPAGVHEIRNVGSGLCVTAFGTGTGSQLYAATCTGSAQQLWTAASGGTIRAEGLCMDVNDGYLPVNTLVAVNTCDGNVTQHFVLNSANDLTDDGDQDFCVQTQGGSQADNTGLYLRYCAGTVDQKWKWAPS
jgi:hypothetical protein